MNPILALLLASVALAACDSADVAPAVAILETAPTQLVPDDDTRDDLAITVEYDDGDGDLGGGLAYVYDCRADGVRTALAVPPLAPAEVVEAGQHIRGTLALHVNDIGAIEAASPPAACTALGAGASRANEAVFCVVLVDAAGHEGAGDCTPAVALLDDDPAPLRGHRPLSARAAVP